MEWGVIPGMRHLLKDLKMCGRTYQRNTRLTLMAQGAIATILTSLTRRKQSAWGKKYEEYNVLYNYDFSKVKLVIGKLAQNTKSRKYTVNNLIEQYETIYLSRVPKRIRSQSHHLEWWRAHYGHKLLSDITSSLLAQAKHALLSETTARKTPRSAPTVNRYFATLSKAFSLVSSEWEWITENPFRKVSKLPENKGRTRFLSKEELSGAASSV